MRGLDVGDTPLHILGVDPFSEPPFRSYLTTVSVDGQQSNAFDALNAFIAEPDTVLISQTTAARYGLKPGDSITLQPPSGRVSVKIVGLLQTSDDASAQALDNLLLTDIATAQELVGKPGTITRIDLILPPGYDLTKIEALLPQGATLTTPSQQNSALGQMTAAFELNLQALSLLALVVGVFLIYNTVSFSVVQRRAVIGILRSIGATRRQIFALVLGEALALGLVGTLLGLGLGMIAGRATVGLVSQTISDLYFAVSVQRVTVDPFTLLKGVAIGLGASLLAAVIPSFDATRTPPAGSMRRSQMEEQALKLLKPVTIGALLLNIVGRAAAEYPLEQSGDQLQCAVLRGGRRCAADADCAGRGDAPADANHVTAVWRAGADGSACRQPRAEPDGGRGGGADGRRERDCRREHHDRLVPLDDWRLARYDAGRGHLHLAAVADGNTRSGRY